MKPYINFALLVNENDIYPVTYTFYRDKKIIENTTLKGGDLTENQIKILFFSGQLKRKPTQEEIESHLLSVNLKEIKKTLNLSQKDIAKFFDMTYGAFANSNAKERYERALCRFYECVLLGGKKEN